MTIHTLQPQAPTIAAPATVAEPGPALSFANDQRRSPTPLDDPGRCHYRYPNGKRCTLPGLPATRPLPAAL